MDTERPSLPLTGGCACGAIRYEITTFPLLLYTCSCTDCQTRSGSAFALNMPVATQSLRIAEGEPKGWHYLSPSGAEVASWFCAACGTRIYGSRRNRPETMNIRAGTLDDTRWLKPIAHFYGRSAQSWAKPAPDAECHQIGPADFQSLFDKWRALWPEFFPAR